MDRARIWALDQGMREEGSKEEEDVPLEGATRRAVGAAAARRGGDIGDDEEQLAGQEARRKAVGDSRGGVGRRDSNWVAQVVGLEGSSKVWAALILSSARSSSRR